MSQKIEMTPEILHLDSWLGHCLISTTTDYCEKKKLDFGKVFLGETQGNPPKEAGKPYIWDVDLKVNGISVDMEGWIKSLEKHVEEETLKKAGELAERVMSDISYDLKNKFDEVLEERLGQTKDDIK